MLQRVAIQYLRGYEGKPMSKFVKRNSEEYLKYREGESDRKKGLPNRYAKLETKTMNKNKTYDCRENEEADALLCMLENNAVLSESFTTKIQNIVLTILTNLEKNEEWVEEQIRKLKDEMDWLMIFSEEFKHRLAGQLLLCFHRQKTLNKTSVQ